MDSIISLCEYIPERLQRNLNQKILNSLKEVCKELSKDEREHFRSEILSSCNLNVSIDRQEIINSLLENYDSEISKKPKIFIKRNKPKNIESLSIIEIARKYTPPSWEELFSNADEELELVSSILSEIEKHNGSFFPKKANIFKAFELCPRNNVKVVIFGQDPYHQILSTGEPRAQGLAFSVARDDVIPCSLNNIFKEISTDLNINKHLCGDLTNWAKQGILLLNSCLTVQPEKPGSHMRIWDGFINRVLKDISQVNPNCIYVLWGAHARKFARLIEGSPPILEAPHPSGFSANSGFFGCKHFSQINKILKDLEEEEIDWSIE